MELDCGGFWDGLIRVMQFIRLDVMADLVVADLKRWGVMPVVAIVLTYRLLIEALIYKRLLRPWFRKGV